MSRQLKRNAAADTLIEVEAGKRARKLPSSERMSSKQIAAATGLAEMYIAQLISRRRRELSIQVDVARGTSTQVDSIQGQAKA